MTPQNPSDRPRLSEFDGPKPIRLHIIDESEKYKHLRPKGGGFIWSKDVPEHLAGWTREINGYTYNLLCSGDLGRPGPIEWHDGPTVYGLASGFVLFGDLDDLVVVDRGPRFAPSDRYVLYGRKRSDV